jgi:putative SOS response-associated peptidase YedK
MIPDRQSLARVATTVSIPQNNLGLHQEKTGDRMPVILKMEDYDLWLDPEVKGPALLKPLLRPYPPDEMIVEPVSPKVNKASYDAPDCIEVTSVKED